MIKNTIRGASILMMIVALGGGITGCTSTNEASSDITHGLTEGTNSAKDVATQADATTYCNDGAQAIVGKESADAIITLNQLATKLSTANGTQIAPGQQLVSFHIYNTATLQVTITTTNRDNSHKTQMSTCEISLAQN